MSRGHDRERDVRRHLQSEEGGEHVVVRAAGSLGPIDLVVLKAGQRPQALEVKSTAGGPYEHFGPSKRAEFLEVARKAGAVPFLVWWPPHGKMQFIPDTDWPS